MKHTRAGHKPAKKSGHLDTGRREHKAMQGLPSKHDLDPATHRPRIEPRVGGAGGRHIQHEGAIGRGSRG